MFSKENQKSIIHGNSITSMILAFLLFSLGAATLVSVTFLMFWVIGFSYTYLVNHNVHYDVFYGTKLLDSNDVSSEIKELICTYKNWSECVSVGSLYFTFIITTLFGLWLIWNILLACKHDITESFEYAQSLTDVHVDKLNKIWEKKAC
jgi:hypothetical protein